MPRDDTPIAIHLNSGQTLNDYLEDEVDAEAIRLMLVGQPRWIVLGGTAVFTQAIAAIELL